MSSFIRARGKALAVAIAVGTGLATAMLSPLGTATAATGSSQLVSAKPSAATPNILDGMNYAITKVGSNIISGGSFTTVAPPGSTTGTAHNKIVAFDASSGAINNAFDPALNNTVRALEPGPTANTVFVGGLFTTVNGTALRSLALLDTTNGDLVSTFKTPAITGGGVFTIKLVGSRLYIGGTFTKVGGKPHAGVAALNATTGAVDTSMNLQVAGHHNYTGQSGQDNNPVGLTKLAVTPDASRMVMIGNFTSVSSTPRDQIAMVDLGGGAASVDPNWNTQAYTAACFSWAFDDYMKDVAFSPDGSYFAVVATGGSGTNNDGTNSSCDTAARWETNDTGSNVRPTWLDYTGQDTLSSVAIANNVVYVGGHQRWLNNSTGYDAPGQGAVPRPGLAALNPATGVPFSWNPGRNPRGVGAYALYVTADGLYVGSDTPWIGNRKYRRERVAMFPFAGGASVPAATTQGLPSNVYLAGQLPTSTNTNILYRVDAGGPTIPAIDDGPDWMADQTDSDPGASFRNTGSNSAQWSPGASETANVPASTPNSIFDSERWDPSDGVEMHWAFPVPAGTAIEVRLYLANRYSGTSQVGQRVFNVSLDGNQVLSNYDMVADVGDQTGTMKAYDITSDGTVDIDFGHVTENPLVDGIEIVKQGAAPPPTGAEDVLQRRSYDGSTVGATSTVSTSGIEWSKVRGAFMVGNTLYYGWTDSNLYERTFNGTSFGAAQLVDPYEDPTWANVSTGSGQTYKGTKPNLYGQLPSVTGMFYLDGKLYYTKLGDDTLYSRWFEPESGIVGSDTFSTSGGSFGNSAGMFYSDGHIYYADRTSGDLKRVDFANGTVSGSPTSVSGPGIDGNDWRARGMFLNG